MAVEEQDISESLDILMRTRVGERILQPDYGCDLDSIDYETMDETTVAEIKDTIKKAVLDFEPRISLEDIDIDANDRHEGELGIHLNYRIHKTNSRGKIVCPFRIPQGGQARN